jgi:hypothetical protein
MRDLKLYEVTEEDRHYFLLPTTFLLYSAKWLCIFGLVNVELD